MSRLPPTTAFVNSTKVPDMGRPTSFQPHPTAPIQRGVPVPDLVPIPSILPEALLKEIQACGYSVPQKCINSATDLDTFTSRSIAYIRIRRLLQTLPLKVSLKRLHTSTIDLQVQGLLNVLAKVNEIIDNVVPLEGPRRFGNMAFRTFHDHLNKQAQDILLDNIGKPKDKITSDTAEALLKTQGSSATKQQIDPYTELVPYFLGSFGSRQRLDFGTGHELSFLAFFGSLWSIELLSPDISGEDILLIFETYFKIIRTLIIRYNLEPAGSHGVWGLDDHFHLPYILGSAQIVDITQPDTPTPRFPPRSVLRPQVVDREKSTNLYFSAIAFINKVKKGPFQEHSPILYDVTSVATWHKIHRGMLKMYVAEVLGKFPVVQHFPFGSGFFPWTDRETGKWLPSTEADEEETDTTKSAAAMHLLNSQYLKDHSQGQSRPTGFNPMNPTRIPW